jgi:chemotaxis methyl-accepting protein methylase
MHFGRGVRHTTRNDMSEPLLEDSAASPTPTRAPFARCAFPPMPDHAYEAWTTLIRERCGLVFGESRRRQLCRAVWDSMRARGIEGYVEYLRFVAAEPAEGREWNAVVERLVNHETCFFRHQPSFDAVSSQVLPQLLEARRRAGTLYLNAWSAGCSTGEEAYSLAMLLAEATDSHLWKPSVVGTDISPAVLARARAGVYRSFSLRSMPEAYQARFLQTTEWEGRPAYGVVASIKALVRFAPFNLLVPETYPLAPQDVIFCQNALIYFDADRRRHVADAICRRLAVGGYAFFAPGEVIGLKSPELESVRFGNALAYRRIA